MAEEPNYQDAGEQPPSTVEQQAPSVAQDKAPSTTSDQSTDIPSANAPDPSAANPEVNPNATGAKTAADETKPAKPGAKKPPAAKADGDKPAPKAAKKEKAPAVEDKPFVEFIQQDYLPALKTALAKRGVKDLELDFSKQKVPIAGYSQDDCWQVMGRFLDGQRQFNLYFPEEGIQGQRAFSCNEGSHPSTLEPFLIDERKITLDLMVFGVVQRLNGQKWLERN